MSDMELLDWLEKHHATVGRSGYRGRDGWEVWVAWPGGHYQEEQTKTLAYGKTAREALTAAMKKQP